MQFSGLIAPNIHVSCGNVSICFGDNELWIYAENNQPYLQFVFREM